MRPAKTQFCSHVELEISYEEQLGYNPPEGINVYWYDRKNTQKPKNRVNASFFCTSINDKLSSQKYMHDINAELAMIGGFVKKDHLKKSDEPELIKNPKIRTEAILSERIFKGERDRILSRARDRHKVKVKNRKVDFGKITEDI